MSERVERKGWETSREREAEGRVRSGVGREDIPDEFEYE